MDRLEIHINAELLTKLLRVTFEKLPNIYYQAYETFLNSRSTSYFRESLISRWISIPVASSIIFRDFGQPKRFANILVETKLKTIIEIDIYVNQYDIIGIKIENNLEDLIFDTINTDHFVLENPPVSNFFVDYADLEGFLSEFDE